MENIKICSVCGKKFKAAKGNFKYCSDKCRNKAKKEIRRKWQQDNNYNILEKYKRREQRKEAVIKLQQEEEAKAVERLNLKETKEQETHTNNLIDLNRRAANGNYLAKAQLCLLNNDAIGYWENIKKYYIAEYLRNGEEPEHNKIFIGGIDIMQYDFIERIKELLKG